MQNYLIQSEMWTSLPEDTHANHSASQGDKKEQTMSAISGQQCLKLSKTKGPLGLLEKMLVGTSIWASTKCSLIWKTKDTKQGRLLFRLVPSMRSIEEIESGLLPTPTVQDGGKATKKWRDGNQNNLTAYIFNPGKFIPTPATADYKGAPKNRYFGSNTYKANLSEAVRLSESCPTHMNPEFLELLMGFPVGWTELEPSETPSSLK